MESTAFGAKSQPTIPPLEDTTMLGTLQYLDGPAAGSNAKLEINGTIDKGFFLADNEWTCYRRNYFSCICSFSVTPHYPSSQLTLSQNGNPRNLPVHGFAMSISAMVADNETHAIDLVQHTPKRDKGPTARPEKVRMVAKGPQPTHLMASYGADGSLPVGSRYDHSFGQAQTLNPSEHTFERIQFKQATANNGKRRAAQQYYHLVVELWADVGPPSGGEHFVRVAFRKSAKMIVRGRSPGHYQSERRGSASSGPGGSAGSLGYGGSQVMGSDFGSAGSGILPGAYGGTYDPRSSSHYSSGPGPRHHQHPVQNPQHPHQQHSHQNHQQPDMGIDHPIMSAEEVKAITDAKEYQYFPAPICDSSHDPRQPVEMFTHSHHRSSEHENILPQLNSSHGPDPLAKVKQETSHDMLPNMYYAGSSCYSNRCARYEGKSSSTGYYPSLVPPASSISMS